MPRQQSVNGFKPGTGLSAVAAATRPAPDRGDYNDQGPSGPQKPPTVPSAGPGTPAVNPARPPTRLDPLATLLAQREGASSAVLMSATGWQALRGARAGALKRRGLLLTPEKRDRGRGRRYPSQGPR